MMFFSTVFMAALAGLSPLAHAADTATEAPAPDPTAPQCEGDPPAAGQWRCGPRGRDSMLLSGAYSMDLGNGPELNGVTLSAGLWDESQNIFGRVLYWAHAGRHDQGDYASVGANLGFFIVPIGPLRIVPEFKVGVGHEWSTPSSGFEALPGIGLELAAWLADKYQVAVGADRDFGSHTGTRNQLMVSVRWSPKYWADHHAPPNNPLQRLHSRVAPLAGRAQATRHAAHR